MVPRGGRRLWFRRRHAPAVDVGLAAERTAMSWQRTALTVAAFSALLVHLAERRLALAVPGLVGLALALGLLLAGERRYAWTVRRVEAGRSPVAPRLALVLAAGVVLLAGAALGLVVHVGLGGSGGSGGSAVHEHDRAGHRDVAPAVVR